MRFLREEIYLFFSRTDLCLKYRFIIPWDYPYIRVAHKMNLDQFRVHLHSESISQLIVRHKMEYLVTSVGNAIFESKQTRN